MGPGPTDPSAAYTADTTMSCIVYCHADGTADTRLTTFLGCIFAHECIHVFARRALVGMFFISTFDQLIDVLYRGMAAVVAVAPAQGGRSWELIGAASKIHAVDPKVTS